MSDTNRVGSGPERELQRYEATLGTIENVVFIVEAE
jgi:hypothetical protein